jgi:hypothetical protein
MARKARPFNPNALKKAAVAGIRPPLGPETLVRRYTVLVPVEHLTLGGAIRPVATPDDIEKLQFTLAHHFSGVTTAATLPSLVGRGARDPRKPAMTRELNRHAYFVVYAAAVRASDDYFLALKKELAEALVEGLILIERQDVTIL